jgi:hypothetical protein
MNLATFPFGTPQTQLFLWDGSTQTRPQARVQFRVSLYHHHPDINHLPVSSYLYIDSLAPSLLKSSTTTQAATSSITLFRK